MFLSMVLSLVLSSLPVAEAATVELSLTLRPEGEVHTWQVELDESLQARTRAPGAPGWELQLQLEGPPEDLALEVAVMEVVTGALGRERLVLVTEQEVHAASGEAVGVLVRANNSMWWRKKERELGFRPSGLMVELTPQV
ncbi:MAG: hypothetical protein H6740_04405 [Alphaproteobacteria bacterium]|nr:hypothetical protein [Alphaproteobacteria bacterium]